MPGQYTEDKLIEETCMKLFHHELGWDIANAFKGETFGDWGSLGRDSEADVILRTRFLDATKTFNKGIPNQAYLKAYEAINADFVAKPLAEINQEKYQYIKDGIPVTFKNSKGEIIRNKKIKIIDFENPENNQFLAVQQLWVEGKSKRRKRPDIIGFVNGIPLLFIELKAHHRKLRSAYEQNLKDYKATIPRLLQHNAFIILSNGLESKIGSITSKFGHFHEWKRIDEKEEGKTSLDIILKGVCEKNRFIDLLENFILFDDSIGSVIKLIARNHQFLGVNKSIKHFQDQSKKFTRSEITFQENQKLGVFWHTQGSGKSYSMVFLCQKFLRKLGGFTFVIITDRVELDKQIYGTFAGAGAVKNKKAQVGSGDDLKEILKTDARYVFSLIHKFNFDETITERDNIIVISDEAHRTQGGTFAINMRNALPNASFIGFTGTPLFKDDEITKRIFGDYVSVYDFKRSIEDGATVPLYYENRGEKLELDNPQINQDIRDAIESADLDSDQEEKLKRLFARDYPILTAKKRLKSIARDVVKHFNSRGYKGKAMFVAIDKVTAVKMYDLITEEWQDYLQRREKEIAKIDDQQEQLAQQKALEWSKKTEVSVVISHEQNEIERFEGWGLNIEPHRLKMNTRDLETEFKDADHPFRFVIVCAMWITGFDVPSLSTMYLDKPLKTHTLMQTIARANRIHEGKNNGLLVDYIETYKSLLEALAIYARGGEKGPSGSGGGGDSEPPVRPVEELIEALEEAIRSTESFLLNELDFQLDSIIRTEGIDKIAAIGEGVEAVKTNDETRNKFGILAREVFKKYKALMPDPAIYTFKDRRDAINAIYATITGDTEEADVTSVVKQVQDVVDSSIESLNLVLEPVEGYGNKVDISGLDFEKIEQEFLKIKNKNSAVQSVKQTVEEKLNKLLNQNPLRINFYEKYQKIIEEYNLGKDYKVIQDTFAKLVELYGELSEEEKRPLREDVTDEELTVLDMLEVGKKLSDKEKGKLRNIAKQLLGRLKQSEFQVQNWADKVQTASAVRKVINDQLFESLPYPVYVQEDITHKTDLLFDFFKSRYGDFRSKGLSNDEDLCLVKCIFLTPEEVWSEEEAVDECFQKNEFRTFVIKNVDQLNEKQQTLMFKALSTTDGKFGCKEKRSVRFVFTSSKDSDDLRHDGKLLKGIFWDRISQLVVELPSYKDDSMYAMRDFKDTWLKMKFEETPGYKHLAELPENSYLQVFIDKHAESFTGGFRDLDKLACMYFNYRIYYYKIDRKIDQETEKDIVKCIKEDFLSKSQLQDDTEIDRTLFTIKEGKSMDELKREFFYHVRSWARKRYGTYQKGADKLGISESTMKNYGKREKHE